MIRVLFAATLLISTGVLSACSPPSESSNREATGDNNPLKKSKAYVKNSCFGTFDEGAAAVAYPASVQETFFHKRYDVSKIDSIAYASPKETYQFALASGVDVFQTVDDVGGCRLFKSLPTADENLLSLWNSANRQGGLLGLFNPTNRVADLGHARPVIMLRGDTTRYTLVHEFMHHLFNEERERHGYNDGVAMIEFQDKIDRLEEISKKKFNKDMLTEEKVLANPKAAEVYMEAWLDLAETRVSIEETFSLEEVTIESTLLQRNEDEKFGPVSDLDKAISREYINTSAANSAGAFQGMRLMTVAIYPLAKNTLKRQDLADRAAVLFSSARVHLDQIDELRKKYVGETTTQALAASGITKTQIKAKAKGCAHVERIRALLKRADRLSKI